MTSDRILEEIGYWFKINIYQKKHEQVVY